MLDRTVYSYSRSLETFLEGEIVLKKRIIRKVSCLLIAGVFTAGVLTGCGGRGPQPIYLPDDETPTAAAAEEGLEAEGEQVYENANGWTVKYDPSRFVINEGGPVSTIVYIGESAGTNMITVTYRVDTDAEGAIKEIGSAYGDKAYYTEGPFIGMEDIQGYTVSVEPDTVGSGAYKTAIARDYMEGALIFEIDGHMGDDEENNMEVSDYLAGVIDSIQFPYE